MEERELVTAVVVEDDDDEEGEDDDRDPLIGGQGADGSVRRLSTRLIYDNSRIDVKSRTRSKCSVRQICMSLLGLVTSSVVIFILLAGEKEEPSKKTLAPGLDYMDFKQPKNMISFQEIMEENFSFNLSSVASGDVMVFLHMQKTGGTTFGKHLVQDIDLERPCDCHRKRNRLMRRKLKCECFTPNGRYKDKNGELDVTDGEGRNWLFSRYSTGWRCGLHADWTELTGCVDNYLSGLEPEVGERRYFYITFLRDPVQRYLSEWKHVKRGATWRKAELRCGNKSWADEVPKCYEETQDESGEWGNWQGVSLKEFMACETNLAVNRQTRMLADLDLVDCYNTSTMTLAKREAIMVASAKTNLERMAYFGLTEEQRISQYLFEETFNLRFKQNFEQLSSEDTHSGSTQEKLDPSVLLKIAQMNHLDAELHRFATKLLLQRFKQLSETDTHFSEHMDRLGQEKYKFSWADIEDENYDDDGDHGGGKPKLISKT